MDQKPKFSRRKFITRGSTLAVVGLGTYAFGVEPRWISVEKHDLPISGLKESLVGKTAVHITDLHIGSRVSDSYLISQFEYIQSLNPDFVFFTGDFLDDGSEWHLEKGLKLLKRFPRGRIGNVSVLGNHDYGSGGRKIAAYAPNTARLIDEFNDSGLNLLLDQTIDLGGLKIAGLRDLWFGEFNPTTARSAIYDATDGPSVVLSHNPDSVDFPIWDGFKNWVLCGHTHGGQCRFPFVGAPIVPVQNKRYVSGVYEIDGRHQLYISRGIGHTHRVRFCSRPEITVFTLHSA